MTCVAVCSATALIGCALAGCGSDEPASAPADASSISPDAGRDAAQADVGSSPAEAGSDAAVAPRKGAPYPIVLVHGMAGFEQLQVGPIGIAYWHDIPNALAAAGEAEVFVTETSPFASSETRARELAPQIEEILRKTGRAKVNLIGHSQGGLDARVLASPGGLNLGAQIASITTIATPHRGTKVADIALGLESGPTAAVTEAVTSSLLKLLSRTLYDRDTDPALRAQLGTLSARGAADFNAQYTDAPGVVYSSYAGRSNLRTGIGVCDDGVLDNQPLRVDAIRPVLAPTAALLEIGIPLVVNDGLVTVQSAKWGTFIGCVPADHLKQIGFRLGPLDLDQRVLFQQMVARVRNQGL
jgi:triacylglycerol lipase